MRPENSPLIALCMLDGHDLWFASTRKILQKRPELTAFSAGQLRGADIAD